MDSNPLVSVIIPIYNVEEYLDECVRSVIAQSYRNLEIILVDDESPDNCPEMCDNYAKKDNRVYVIHKKNAGLGAARNTGMDLAHGEYIIFLDSDDYWSKNTIEILVNEAEEKNLQVIMFAAEPFLDGIEKGKVHMTAYNHDKYCYTVASGIQSYWRNIEDGEYYAQACMRFCSLQYLKNRNFRFDEGIIHEDESWSFFSYVLADRVECISNRLYKRRYRSGSIMTSESSVKSCQGYSVSIANMLQAYEEKEFEEKDFKNAILQQIDGYMYNIVLQYNTIVHQNGLLCEAANEISAYVTPQLKRIRAMGIPLNGKLRYYRYGLPWGNITKWIINRARAVYHYIRKR